MQRMVTILMTNRLQLHQTGKILRDPNRRNARQSGLTQMRIGEYVPFANQQFHDALDEIEVEIVCEHIPNPYPRPALCADAERALSRFTHTIYADTRDQLQAKAVMERDLSLIRKKRVERERVANGLKAQPSPEEALDIPHLDNKETLETPTNNITESTREAKEEDTLMTDFALEADLAASKDEPQAEAPENTESDSNNISRDPGMPQDAEDSMGLAITMPQDSIAEATEPPKSPEKKNSGTTPAAEAPPDAGATDLDFESMFNDTDLTGGGDTIDFGIDFASDGNLNQAVLNDNTFENMEISNVDMSSLGATRSEDINTLLPGLENYVNAGADFSNVNVPVASTLPETSQVAPVGTSAAPAQASTQPAVADSSLDDIFGSGDFSMDGIGDDGMGGGTFGDLEDFDEDWFKTDQT